MRTNKITQLTQEQETLLLGEPVKKLIKCLVSRYARSGAAAGLDRKDLEQEAWVAAMEAARADRHASFITVAYRFISNRLYYKTRRPQGFVELTSLDEVSSSEDGCEVFSDERELLPAAMGHLTLEERRLVKAWFWGERSAVAIAKQLQISPRQVYNRLNATLAKLRTELQ